MTTSPKKQNTSNSFLSALITTTNISCFIFICLLATEVSGEDKPLVYLGESGKLIYVPHANHGDKEKVNVIPNFSYCGYRRGGVKIPDVPVKVTISHSNDGDHKKRIQGAINEVSKMPLDENGFRGAVLIKAGAYTYQGQLSIHTSGVVLRGEGKGPAGTILYNNSEKRNVMVLVAPRENNKPGFKESEVSRISNDYVGTGAMSFRIEDSSKFKVGDDIRVYFTPNQQWLNDIHVNPYIGKKGNDKWTTEAYTIGYERKITQIKSEEVFINSPLVCPLKKNHGGGEIRKVTLRKGNLLENVGVEYLTLKGVGITKGVPLNSKNRVKDSIRFEYASHSWVRSVDTYHQYFAAVNLSKKSCYITVQDVYSLEPMGPRSGGYYYAFIIAGNPHHNLIQRCFAFHGRHDFVPNGPVPGPNVYLDCVSRQGGTQGAHHRWATGTLFDNINSRSLLAICENRGGSGSGHGWTGVSHVGWNTKANIVCDTPTGFLNYSFGTVGKVRPSIYVNNKKKRVHSGYSYSHGEHVLPRSLYLQQLEDRLGKQAVMNVTVPEQRQKEFELNVPNLTKGKKSLN